MDLFNFSVRIPTMRKMQFIVFGICYQQKIVKFIIKFISIYMVNVLVWFKGSTQKFCHYKSMLSDLSGRICVGMIGLINSYITQHNTFSTFPVRVCFPNSHSTAGTLIPGSSTFLCLANLRAFFSFIPRWQGCMAEQFHCFRNLFSSGNFSNSYHFSYYNI